VPPNTSLLPTSSMGWAKGYQDSVITSPKDIKNKISNVAVATRFPCLIPRTPCEASVANNPLTMYNRACWGYSRGLTENHRLKGGGFLSV
jgi:hypothetical protein